MTTPTTPPNKTFITDLRAGALISSPFLALYKNTRRGKRGNYLAVTLADRTGSIEARIWDNADDISQRFEAKDFVQIRGEVASFDGQLQINVFDLRRVPSDSIDLTNFMPSSRWPSEALWDQLCDLVRDRVQSPFVKALLLDLLDDPVVRPRLLVTPAATRNHHAYLGGLVEHVLSMSRLAVRICDHYRAYYPGLVDEDLVIAGCILHDIAKIYELNVERGFSYSDEGLLLGHLVMGIDLVAQFANHIPDFPADLLLRLKHLVASHHEKLEFGSPKIPQTVEAIVLHHIDNIDAKLNQLNGLIERHLSLPSPTPWTERSPSLERSLWVGTASQNVWRAPPPPLVPLVGPGLAGTPPPASAPQAVAETTAAPNTDKPTPLNQAPSTATNPTATDPTATAQPAASTAPTSTAQARQRPLWPPEGFEPCSPPDPPFEILQHAMRSSDTVEIEEVPSDIDFSMIWPPLPPPPLDEPKPEAKTPPATQDADETHPTTEPEPGSAAADGVLSPIAPGIDLFSFPLRKRR